MQFFWRLSELFMAHTLYLTLWGLLEHEYSYRSRSKERWLIWSNIYIRYKLPYIGWSVVCNMHTLVHICILKNRFQNIIMITWYMSFLINLFFKRRDLHFTVVYNAHILCKNIKNKMAYMCIIYEINIFLIALTPVIDLWVPQHQHIEGDLGTNNGFPETHELNY